MPTSARSCPSASALALAASIALAGDVSGIGTTGSIINVTLPAVATAGTYGKVTINAKGLVTAGGTLSASDVSGLSTVARTGAYGDLSGAPTPYSLPPAGAATLGGVKVGSGLSALSDGTLRLVYAGALTPIYEVDVAIEALSELTRTRPELPVRLDVYGRREDGVRWRAFGDDANAGMLREFLDAVRDGRQPAITGTDGLRAVEIVDAAYRSIASGAPVGLG